ncbi:MAG: hypothetical protein ACTSPG_10320 [Candidatus Hodarchaeales archaeon]
MSVEDSIRALRLFNRKAERLKDSSFTDYINRRLNRASINYSIENGLSIERIGASQEEIEAFALTLRFFMQDNEPCSFHNMASHYDEIQMPQELHDCFTGLRDGLNSFLDNGESMVVENGNRIKFREVLETFIWGDLAHSNSDYEQKFSRWMVNSVQSVLLYLDFVYILSGFLQNIFAVQELNIKVIENYEREHS